MIYTTRSFPDNKLKLVTRVRATNTETVVPLEDGIGVAEIAGFDAGFVYIIAEPRPLPCQREIIAEARDREREIIAEARDRVAETTQIVAEARDRVAVTTRDQRPSAASRAISRASAAA